VNNPKSKMKGVTVLAIMGILVGSYLGGKMSNTGTVEYEFAEVYDAVGSCEEGSFMGGCSACKECAAYEYNGGGCSYFKDTLCVLCEPIKNCGTVEDEESGKLIPAVVCDDGFNEVCNLCQNGYWDPDCKPCKVCDAGFYETVQCTQDNDTECEACTECDDNQFLSTACTYTSDSECTDCTICTPGDFSEVVCQKMETVYTETADTVCTTCTECADTEGSYVTTTCSITADTKCADDERCEEGEYINEVMEAGTWDTLGDRRSCHTCTKLAGGKFVQWKCDRDDFKDGLHMKCTQCADCGTDNDDCDVDAMGEYQLKTCTDTSDTVCPSCPPVKNCEDGFVKCDDAKSSECQQCSEGFYGDNCCYEKAFSACGTMTTRERRADAYGYDGESTEEFIEFCLSLCEEFPDCMAFEIEDGGTDYESSGEFVRGGRGDQCYFKSAYSQLTNDFAQDCYSNTCRQGDNFRDFDQYEEAGLISQANALVSSHKNGSNH